MSAELVRRIASASAYAEPVWDAAREARIRAGVGRGLERGRRRRVALVVLAGACTLLLGFFLGRQEAPSRARMALPAPAPANLLELPDGSRVSPASSGARVEAVAVAPDNVTLRLDAGTARFSVAPNPNRPFRVIARDVSVTVLGTVFTVGVEPKAVRVAVERGRVRVDTAEGSRELGVGESATFESKTEAPPEPVVIDPLPPVVAARPQAAPAQPSWRALAKDQNYGAALARLLAEGPNAVRDSPEDLLLAADVARLGGRPDRAVAPLQRVIADHAFDPRAPLAAFTLGRTLLEQLGRPREAAQAFATARRLDRGGTLTQDALAREVESWAGAGEAEQAHERALEYLKLYPKGRRAAAVRRLGSVE
jgi:transmembrane sensor